MPARKYLEIDSNGNEAEVTATIISSGSASDGNLVALDANGRLDSTVMPNGIGATTSSIVSSEALVAGDLVSIWLNAGVANVRKADNTAANAGRSVDGYVLAAVASGAAATVFTDNGTVITGLSSLTIGATYYLGTAGNVTLTPPTAAGTTLQRIGKALSATSIKFDPSQPIIRG